VELFEGACVLACLCVGECMCAFVHVYVCVHAYVGMFLRACVHVHVYVLTVLVHVYVLIVCMRVCVCVHMYVCTCMCAYACMRVVDAYSRCSRSYDTDITATHSTTVIKKMTRREIICIVQHYRLSVLNQPIRLRIVRSLFLKTSHLVICGKRPARYGI